MRVMLRALAVAVAGGIASSPAALAAVILFQNGFESADVCAWGSSDPAATCDPDMVFVPAGKFTMGSDFSSAELPIHDVTLDAFWIDRTEVTVDQYSACVTAASCTAAGTSVKCNAGVAGRGDHPINCVDWSQALAYCIWAGKRLPTEAEWEKAARGTDARTRPWGEETATCDYAVVDDASAGGFGCGLAHTGPVGTKPAGASPYGALDLMGNAWEWVNDWYSPTYYSVSPPSNPPGPVSGDERTIRGGAWGDGSGATLRSAYRIPSGVTGTVNTLGFRCAAGG